MSIHFPFQVGQEIYQSYEFPADMIAELQEQNCFKLFLPQDLGGTQSNLREGISQIYSFAEIQASLGWIVNLGSGASYFYRFFSKEAAIKIFKEKNSVIGGSGQTTGKAQKVDGGFYISGGWSLCSGAAHASHFSANAVFEDGKVHSVIFTKDQVTIKNDWSFFAMKPTSSFRIEAENVFVPEEFVFDIDQIKFEDDYRNSEIPFDVFARFCMLANLIGSVSCFAHHLEKEFLKKIRSFDQDIKNLKSTVNSNFTSLLELADRYEKIIETGNKINEHQLLSLKSTSAMINRNLFDRVCDLFYKTGFSLTDETKVTHHAFKDVMMVSQHGMMK